MRFLYFRKELVNMAKRICIIVGHGKSASGGYDSGAVSKDKKYHEFKIAREIAKHCAAELKAAGFDCELMNYMGDLYLTERVKAVNKGNYDFIAEIHLNAGGGTGSEVFYYNGSPTGKKYAEAISKSIATTFSIRDRGAKVKLGKNGKDYFAIIRDTEPCAVLVETVFIDTANDLSKVTTTAGQYRCGEAIARAIANINGVKLDNAAASNTAKKQIKAGAAVKLNKTPVYISSTAKTTLVNRTGTYYIYDAVEYNGRYRITNKAANCGKKPAALYVTGYINKSDI
jgi:N-acetylmuramoyl-L-alanine amidase